MKTLVLCYLVAVCLVCVINAGPVTEDENHTDNLVNIIINAGKTFFQSNYLNMHRYSR